MYPSWKQWNPYDIVWLVVSTHLKHISQLGWLFPIHGRIKHVPNHQPVVRYCKVLSITASLWSKTCSTKSTTRPQQEPMKIGGTYHFSKAYPAVSSNMACWKMDHRNQRFSSSNLHSVRGFPLPCLITRGYMKPMFQGTSSQNMAWNNYATVAPFSDFDIAIDQMLSLLRRKHRGTW